MATKQGRSDQAHSDQADVRALKGLLLAIGISGTMWAGMAEIVHLML